MSALARDMETRWMMTARVGDAPLRQVPFVAPTDSLRQAARVLAGAGAGCVLLRLPGGFGVVTGDQLLCALAAEDAGAGTAVGTLCRGEPLVVGTGASLASVLAALSDGARGPLLVIDESGEPLGLLAVSDLLTLLAGHSSSILERIQRAPGTPELITALAAMIDQIELLHGSGIHARQLGRYASEVNGAIFRRVFELCFPDEVRRKACLIVMGSEGRGEQILPTDQDNALIVADGVDMASLREPCSAFTGALIEIGYAACPGEIMVRNPEWAMDEAAFRRRVRDWVIRADNTDVMNLAIFLDAAPVAGEAELFRRLRAYLDELVSGGDGFYARFASAIVAFPPPLGLLSRLRIARGGEHPGTLDIKKSGIFQIVHGVRSLAMEKGVAETPTLARIARLMSIGTLDRRMGRDVAEAFEFLSALRARVGLEARAAGRRADNLIRPAALTDFDRDMLRDSLRVVMRFREMVKQHFRLEMLGF